MAARNQQLMVFTGSIDELKSFVLRSPRGKEDRAIYVFATLEPSNYLVWSSRVLNPALISALRLLPAGEIRTGQLCIVPQEKDN